MLGGQGGVGAAPATPIAAANSPRADYPVVTGDPYTIDGQTFTPEDVMNYDEVGVLALDSEGGDAVSGAHHTLPLPSYVEVTSLETGRTILVRLERRGPMQGTQLLALAPGALAQLGAQPGVPVRVRRVNPPEDQRALLRSGQAAAPRMDTPMALVAVLKRKLPGSNPVPNQSASSTAGPAVAAGPPRAPGSSSEPALPSASASVPAPRQTVAEAALPPLTDASREPAARPSPTSVASATPEAVPSPVASAQAAPARPAPARPAPERPVPTPAASPKGDFVVQAAAFSTAERARQAATTLGGTVSRSGAYWRVRTGPFATRGAAEASLAKVKGAGYSDARIYTGG
jgi:rare lipoprotein A